MVRGVRGKAYSEISKQRVVSTMELVKEVATEADAILRNFLTLPLEAYIPHYPAPFNTLGKLQELQSKGTLPELPRLADGLWVALLVSILRTLLFYVLTPLGSYLMKHKTYKGEAYRKLDSYYRSISQKPDKETMQSLADKNSLTYMDVKLYFASRRNQGNTLQKYFESAVKFIIYLVVTSYGLAVVSPKPWFLDVKQCWTEYFEPMAPEVHWYYVMELGIYTHFFVYHFFERRRKDFWEMLIHHIATVILIAGSYVTGHYRIGTLVMLLHDTTDIFLEAAKVINYLCPAHPKLKPLTDLIFQIFALSFFVTRLVLFPFVVIRSLIKDAISETGAFPGDRSLTWLLGFLLVLLVLHIFWFYLICRMAYKMIVHGTVEKDERSEDEDELDDSDAPVGANGHSHPVSNGKKHH